MTIIRIDKENLYTDVDLYSSFSAGAEMIALLQKSNENLTQETI